MGYNVEWMSTDKVEVWTYQGRLYQTEKMALRIRDEQVRWMDEYAEQDRAIPPWYYGKDYNVYKGTIEWSLVGDEFIIPGDCMDKGDLGPHCCDKHYIEALNE